MLRLAASTLGLIIASSAFFGCAEERASAAPSPPPPIEVRVTPAELQEVPNAFAFIGTVEAIARVELRARVRGYVTDIPFQEGSVVEKGEILFEIDTRPFKAERRAVQASLRRVRTRLEEAKQQLEREQHLLQAGVSAQEALDMARADVDALSAEVREQQAALDQAELEIGYSKIRAPFRGRIGERLVDRGELVGGTDATLLAVLVQEDPVYVRFSPTERERRRILALDPDVESPPLEGGATVELVLSDGARYPEVGRLTFIDNAIDPNVRSLVYKALVDNPLRQLKPGESVEVTLRLPPTEHLLIPNIAVASVQNVDYVYVVDEGVAQYREIEVGRAIGQLRIVHAGLEPGDAVVVHGLQRLSNGAPVEVKPGGVHAIAAAECEHCSPAAPADQG